VSSAESINTVVGTWARRRETLAALRRVIRTRVSRPKALSALVRRDWYGQLRRDGVVAIPGFWSKQRCSEARAELARLELAYPDCIRRRSDRRLFGVNRASANLREFAEHPDLVALSRAFYRVQHGSCITLGAILPFTTGNAGSGEGWHRDSLSPQFKTILYLTDVSLDEGPFELVPGSHRLLNVAGDILAHSLGSRIRLSEAEVQHIIERHYPRGVATLTGEAGTLLLVDSSAIHRGRPIAKGERVALTNYYYPAHPLPARQEQHFEPLLPHV
jgi:hypothetical protein